MTYTNADGWTVETATMSLMSAPTRHHDASVGDGEYLIVRRYGKTVAFTTSPVEVAQYVDLATLSPR